jgi:hypothetical protein
VTRSAPASTTLYPQEIAAAEVAARVLGAAVRPSDTGELTLAYPDGRLAALEEATLGDRADLGWPPAPRVGHGVAGAGALVVAGRDP